MANYTKKAISITVTTVNGSKFELTDNDVCSAASMALSALKSGGANLTVGDKTYYVPSTAVDNIEITLLADEEYERNNEPCSEGSK